MSVTERETSGLRPVRPPAQASPAFDAFIDLREALPSPRPTPEENAPHHPHTADADSDRAADNRADSRADSRPDEKADARELMRRYQTHAVTGDAVLAAIASAVATVIRFGDWHQLSYVALSVAVPVLWVLLLAAKRGYEPRFLGRGPEEYRRLWEAGLLLFIAMAVLSFSVKGDVARGYVCLVVPVTLVLTIGHRTVLREWAARLRSHGHGVQNVLVVGPHAEAETLFDRLRAGGVRSLRPVGIYPHHADAGGLDAILSAVEAAEAHVVAVVADAELSGQTLRELSWALEELGVDLVVDPGLVDVAGGRLSIHPMNDLSLLHVHRTRPSGERMAAKAVFDRVLAVAILLALSPALVAIALAVRLTSRGPVLFRQTRVGVDGGEFTMLKFRSMVVDADRLLDQLREQSDGNGVLFKMKDDPRVTPVGGFLRKYSLDELPQLVNVVRGEMSLVGPRPPLPSEVAGYDGIAYRRLRLRPGLTGLWQVSGRSDLSWEDSLRLDLRYVDNWSMALDLQILLRTFRAVFAGVGAY
ncbi:MAG TPA: sugar transferase [Kineosporiaceae bacterium]|nr:sugar transferase [Kineosporiaceae bacterium]